MSTFVNNRAHFLLSVLLILLNLDAIRSYTRPVRSIERFGSSSSSKSGSCSRSSSRSRSSHLDMVMPSSSKFYASDSRRKEPDALINNQIKVSPVRVIKPGEPNDKGEPTEEMAGIMPVSNLSFSLHFPHNICRLFSYPQFHHLNLQPSPKANASIDY